MTESVYNNTTEQLLQELYDLESQLDYAEQHVNAQLIYRTRCRIVEQDRALISIRDTLNQCRATL